MTIGVPGFQGVRLTQAREARGLTAIALADLVGVSASAISQYERKGQNPREEVLARTANALNLPLQYFLNPMTDRSELAKIFYRSMSAATKSARARAERRYEWLREIFSYLDQFFDYPEVKLPDFDDLTRDHYKLTAENIESIADQTRQHWNLGMGPITNMVRTLESHGIVVARGNLEAETLDAFSELDPQLRPFVFLGADKNCMVRSRFDAAHELGHFILHRRVNKKAIRNTREHKQIELQAHRFASAFLLPARSFVNELPGVSLEAFRSLKGRWKIAIGAMIRRCEDLRIINEPQAKRLWINLSRRGWRKKEPLDGLPVEQPQLLSRSFEMLVDKGVRTREQILSELRLAPTDIEELTGLKPGFLKARLDQVPSPQLKEPLGTNIIPFGRTT